MIEKKTYIADDGKQFNDMEKCLAYEKLIKSNKDLFKAKELIANYCSERDCNNCIFYNSNSYYCSLSEHIPSNW